MHLRKLAPAFALLAAMFALTTGARANPGNETIATASPLSWSGALLPNYGSTSGVILPYDVDFYVFQVYQGGLVDFDLPGGSSFSLMSPRIDVFDPAGGQISGVDGRSLALFLDPGVYYPRISSSSNGLGAYNFTVVGDSPYGNGSAQIGPVQAAVPEAGSLPLLAVGGLALGAVAARRRRLG